MSKLALKELQTEPEVRCRLNPGWAGFSSGLHGNAYLFVSELCPSNCTLLCGPCEIDGERELFNLLSVFVSLRRFAIRHKDDSQRGHLNCVDKEERQRL